MIARGRKSAASRLALNSEGDRPDPPAHLSGEEADEWRRVVLRMPSGWFRAETHGLLATYCAHVANLQLIQNQLRVLRASSKNPGDVLQLAALMKLHQEESKQIASLAVKLRLAPSARYDRRQAGIALRESGGPKPWEIIGLRDEDDQELDDVLVHNSQGQLR
jgi:phage terminase small subunit